MYLSKLGDALRYCVEIRLEAGYGPDLVQSQHLKKRKYTALALQVQSAVACISSATQRTIRNFNAQNIQFIYVKKKKDVLSILYACLPSYASVHSMRLAKIILFGGKILLQFPLVQIPTTVS